MVDPASVASGEGTGGGASDCLVLALCIIMMIRSVCFLFFFCKRPFGMRRVVDIVVVAFFSKLTLLSLLFFPPFFLTAFVRSDVFI